MRDIDPKKEKFADAMSNLMKNDLGMSIELLNEMIDAEPGDKLALLARGAVYMKRGDTEHSASDFGRVIELDGSYAKAYHLRGLAREMAGNDDEALKDFNKAIEVDPQYGAAYYSRATLFTKLGREDSAAEDMQTISHLTNRNIEQFANENNVWRSRHLQMESIMETETGR
jgi:tetratricopeptide (TPR) repeat protein